VTSFIIIVLLIAILCTVSPFARGIARFMILAIVAIWIVGYYSEPSKTTVAVATTTAANREPATFVEKVNNSGDCHLSGDRCIPIEISTLATQIWEPAPFGSGVVIRCVVPIGTRYIVTGYEVPMLPTGYPVSNWPWKRIILLDDADYSNDCYTALRPAYIQ
jgi:hypothetical protein